MTSVSPSLDPNSRTGIVEAVYSNNDGKFLPGQFITMQIEKGSDAPSVVIPRQALQAEEAGDFVWVAKAAMNGEFTVSRMEVEVSARSGESVAIKSGVQEGEQVVVSPPYGLAAGQRVSSETMPETASAEQTIEVTDAGYSPPSIRVPPNRPFKITFVRRAAETCGDTVVFPELGINRALPLNEPITIELPAMAAGKSLAFA